MKKTKRQKEKAYIKFSNSIRTIEPSLKLRNFSPLFIIIIFDRFENWKTNQKTKDKKRKKN